MRPRLGNNLGLLAVGLGADPGSFFGALGAVERRHAVALRLHAAEHRQLVL